MQLDLNETQALLRDTLREFLSSELSFERVRSCERSGQADDQLWDQLRGHGWLGTPLPSEVGGGDGGLVEAGLLVEELARRAAVVPIAEQLSCGATLQRYAAEPRVGELLSGLAAGELCVVPAVLEASDRFGDVTTIATGDGSLRGQKFFVDYAEAATHHLVAARRGREVGLHLVDARGPGVKSDRCPTMGRTPQSIVHYDGAASEPLCGAEAHVFLVQVARALCTVQILSSMQVALEQTVAYTSVREQFGRPIGSFQAVQHHAANMAIEVEATRFLAYEALDGLQRDTATPEQVAIAKAVASRAAPEVTMLAHQLHGGQGYIEENDLYFFTLRARDRSLAWGTADECLEIVADGVDAQPDWL